MQVFNHIVRNVQIRGVPSGIDTINVTAHYSTPQGEHVPDLAVGLKNGTCFFVVVIVDFIVAWAKLYVNFTLLYKTETPFFYTRCYIND